MPTQIAIVDDQRLFREGMRMILENDAQYEIVFEAANGQELLDQLAQNQVELVLLDYTMPIMDGYEAMKAIKATYPDTYVVFLSMHYDESLMVYLMEQGAHGFLLKDESSQVVKQAIDNVMETGQYFPSYVSKALLNQLKSQQKSKKVRLKTQEENRFSRREIEILEVVGKYSRQELAKRLFISIKTVDFHLKNLRDKTQAGSTAELVNFAIRNGYQD